MGKWARCFVAVLVTLSGHLVPAHATEDLSRCGAVTLSNRPALGQTENWNTRPVVRRHNRFLRTHRRVFASGYLSGKHFYVGFTREVCKHLRRFRDGLPQRWRVRAFEANFSYRRLRRAQACVREMMGNERLGISAVGSDVHRNKVDVMLERDTNGRRRTIRRACGTIKPRILYFTEGTVTPE